MISKKQIISDKDFGKIHFVVRRSARNITMRVKEDGLHVTTPPYRSITALLEAIAPFRERLRNVCSEVKPKPFDLNFSIEAAKLAHADGFIRMLPQGYDTHLSGDGEELSQGQRQLLAIARAAIADPPVLILDEATSSIDTRTEQIVQQGMDNLMRGRTVFVIAHRLSTIRNSDAIMVLEHGRIIERGTHDELLKLKGTYYQLYTGKLELS